MIYIPMCILRVRRTALLAYCHGCSTTTGQAHAMAGLMVPGPCPWHGLGRARQAEATGNGR